MKEVMFLSGSNVIFRKEVLQNVALYEEKFKRNHEDTSMSEKIIASGKKLIYFPKARVTHIKKDTVYSLMRTCWGFRHREYPRSVGILLRDIVNEIKHALSITYRDVRKMRWQLLGIDFLYVFIQLFFCIKAFLKKRADFA